MKGNKQSETSVKKTDKKSEKKTEQKKEEKKEVHRCDQCKWYDVSTQRDFHRDGIREGLVEVRAVCRSPTSRARNHLVKNDSDRPCFEAGVYVKPEKPKKEVKEKGKKKAMTGKEANEYAEKFVKENIGVTEKSLKRKNGDVVILEKRKGKTYVRSVNQ